QIPRSTSAARVAMCPGMSPAEPSAVLVTGISAAGKSTVGRLLAQRFARGAFVEGDLMWKLVVSGRVDMTPDAEPEAIRQLHRRHRNGAALLDGLVADGFTAVHADIVLGEEVALRRVGPRTAASRRGPGTVARRRRAPGTRSRDGRVPRLA